MVQITSGRAARQVETLKSQKIEMKKRWRSVQEFDGEVDEEVIAEVVGSMTGIPLMRMEKDEIERLLEAQAELHRKVVDPGRSRRPSPAPFVVHAVVSKIRTARWAASSLSDRLVSSSANVPGQVPRQQTFMFGDPTC
ncbi:MAG: hypothetical protein R3E58_05225 [Phycisphaerae bacterium]